MASNDLVVYSHLRWGFVHQRPQHLMSRLAVRGWRVHFIEEPVYTEGPARLDCHSPMPGVHVVVPHTPVPAAGFHDDQIAVLEGLLAKHLEDQRATGGVAWLYTPMALPVMKTARARVVVYDCMDELSAFKDAPRQLRQREIALTKRADLIFTGGPSLYLAKRGLHPHVHCLPSAVDAEHFAPSRLRFDSAPAARARMLQYSMPQPRLGFYGVIDERLDVDLVAHLADARPGWQIVMVGPVVKIDPARLPKRPNLHWLGMQDYDTLPYLMAGWDVCLMPFAMNESTRFISPTKTLEYMAGGKPVVSTPVHDVVQLYGTVVAVAPAGDAFVDACQAMLDEPVLRIRQRAEAMVNTVLLRSWDYSVAAVQLLLEEAFLRTEDASNLLEPTAATGTHNTVPMRQSV
ncbi:MAG TPA: glycosyltransferase [Burkholderiaceae bacterium]|nr:glycosyltransferase [Burkholderiaceae bacterium]